MPGRAEGGHDLAWDVIAVAKKDLEAGTVLGSDLEYSE
jgi:predicted homoserine dehydrogenase-like protein